MEEHEFTATIRNILKNNFDDNADTIFENSYLIRYLNKKTKSVSSGSKSRGSFANHYAIYVLVEDYIDKGYIGNNSYHSDYKGAVFTELLTRIKKLPFGDKLQNHALNSRVNAEFKGIFQDAPQQPIIRDLQTKRYWINEDLLKITIDNHVYNVASVIIKIIDAYIAAKTSSFKKFIEYTKKLANISDVHNGEKAKEFITEQLQLNVDARIFEIVSYSILKSHYAEDVLYWGWSADMDKLKEENLRLYKTGRTNANDGGIDFVMKPLGRFFQVTETLDFKKYFLDIDKIQRYPITFVIKTDMTEDAVYKKLRKDAMSVYSINKVVDNYMESIEEIINIPYLLKKFSQQAKKGKIKEIMDEIALQSQLEFNQFE